MIETSPDFQALVLDEIRRQSRCGARYPSPVSLLYSGDLTDAAKRLGCRTTADMYEIDLERLVHAAVKRLHEAGKVLFIWRYGYTWVVLPGAPHTPEEVVDAPAMVNCPTGWDSL